MLKPVTPEVKCICIQVKPQVEKKAQANFAVYTPLDFISKDEAGVNYTYIVKSVAVTVSNIVCHDILLPVEEKRMWKQSATQKTWMTLWSPSKHL
ncbi:Cystatin-A [Labeo rohita]|uniref:Cystatin-A n=1 Tax=Labeo rohita TaxID=84645 RepID=A0ABQ8MQC2_LABRO|nr:Cystatin-A [Labeo rohita]